VSRKLSRLLSTMRTGKYNVRVMGSTEDGLARATAGYTSARLLSHFYGKVITDAWNPAALIFRRLPVRRLLAILLLITAFCTTGFSPPGLTDSDLPTTVITSGTAKQMSEPAAPGITAASAVAIDADTGMVVYDKNSHERRSPASTTKMMTALVALERMQAQDKVTAAAADLVGGSTMGLQAGDSLRAKDMLYGLLINSGNDAAEALARYTGSKVNAGEPRAAFIQLMNEKAKRLGLADTHFVNPSGLDEDGHYSSAYDLAWLARSAMLNPSFAKVVGIKEQTVVGDARSYKLVKTNELLGTYPGADGIKTGTTDQAGECLVASVTRSGHELIVVVLGSTKRYDDAKAILDYSFARYKWADLSARSDNVLRVFDASGQWRPLETHGQSWRLMPVEYGVLIRQAVIINDAAKNNSRTPAAWVRYYLGSRVFFSVPLYFSPAAESVNDSMKDK
jgi:serine-type D-Ala-D-Ala carboxypeptidase (penicillin-binding protein 5/6)